jgi:8-oxo-dGTP pyrophosphatase MutT (NUDIX family)
MSFEECLQRLRQGFERQLPGAAAQLTMAPEYRHELSFLSVAGKKCRDAAVLVLMVPVEGAASLVFTLRHSRLLHHAGQISFPGGRRDPGETLVQAAVREAWEEVGLEEKADIIGQLTPLYVPPSNFCVYPFVAAIDHLPPLRPHEAEVEAILYVPVSSLLDPQTRSRSFRELPGRTGWVPYFDLDGRQLWGATAMILAELLALLAD